jgi:hypothetical protein
MRARTSICCAKASPSASRLSNGGLLSNSFDLTDFPVLTMDDLRDLTMGVYQLKQAPKYTREHIEPEYELFLVKDDSNLIKCKIQSRYTNSAVHTLWVAAQAMLLGGIAHVRSVPGLWDAVPTWRVLFGIWAIKDTQK